MPTLSNIQQQYDVNEDQLKAVHFLANVDYGNKTANSVVQEPTIITTHCAQIILTKNRAYKIKRAIQYNTAILIC